MKNRPNCKNCKFFKKTLIGDNICYRVFDSPSARYFDSVDSELKYHTYYEGNILDSYTERSISCRNKCGPEGKFFVGRKDGFIDKIIECVFGDKNDY